MSKMLMMNELMSDMVYMESRMKRIKELISVLSVGVVEKAPKKVEQDVEYVERGPKKVEQDVEYEEEEIECSCCFERYNKTRFIECNKSHFLSLQEFKKDI